MHPFNVKMLRESSKLWFDWFLTLFQLAFVVSALAGSVFVWIYLRSVGAPLPAADLPALTSLFLAVTILFSLFGIIGSVFIVLPSIICGVPRKFRDQVDAAERSALSCGKRLTAWSMKTVLFNGAFYLSLIGLLITVLFRLLDYRQVIIVILFIALGIVCSYVRARTLVGWDPSFRREAVFCSAGNGLVGFLWSFSIFWPAVIWFPFKGIMSIDEWADMLLIVIAPVYLSLTSLADKTRWRGVLALTTCIVLVPSIACPSSIGAGTLRMLGVGGGMPVSILLAPLPGTKPDVEMLETRCLILNSGSQMILRPRTGPESVSCADSRAPFLAKSSPLPGIFSSVDIVPTARVLEIVPLMPTRNAAINLGRL